MAEPMPGPPPDGDRNRAPGILLQTWASLGIAIVAISLRLISRRIVGRIGIDDWMMLFTVVDFGVSCIIATIWCVYGGGKHMYYIPKNQLLNVARFSWAQIPCQISALATGEISNALLIVSIMGPHNFWRRWILYIGMGVTAAVAIVDILVENFQCRPWKALWIPNLPGAHCMKPRKVGDVDTLEPVLDFSFNIILAIVPVTIIWKLNMGTKKKVGLSVVLGLGIVAAACSAAAYVVGRTQSSGSRDGYVDLEWVIANLYQWRSAEIIVIILVGCIPTWGPVINRYVRKIKALRFVPSRECFRPRPDPFGEGTSTTLRTVSQAHAKQGMPESWIDLDYNHAIRSANNAIRVDQTIEISNEVA